MYRNRFMNLSKFYLNVVGCKASSLNYVQSSSLEKFYLNVVGCKVT